MNPRRISLRSGIVLVIALLLVSGGIATAASYHHSGSHNIVTKTVRTGSSNATVSMSGNTTPATTTQPTYKPVNTPTTNNPPPTPATMQTQAAQKIAAGIDCYATITPLANTYENAVSSDITTTDNAINVDEQETDYTDTAYVNQLTADGNAALNQAYATYMQSVKSLGLTACNTRQPPVLRQPLSQ
jgi:hypothetical protein